MLAALVVVTFGSLVAAPPAAPPDALPDSVHVSTWTRATTIDTEYAVADGRLWQQG